MTKEDLEREEENKKQQEIEDFNEGIEKLKIDDPSKTHQKKKSEDDEEMKDALHIKHKASKAIKKFSQFEKNKQLRKKKKLVF